MIRPFCLILITKLIAKHKTSSYNLPDNQESNGFNIMARIPFTVSIDPLAYDAIERLSKLQGSSKSSIINEYLVHSVDTINSVADMIEMLKNSTPEQREAFKIKMEAVEQQALTQYEELNKSTKGLLHD